MPYTPEELKELSFYQKLIERDEQQYLLRKQIMLEEASTVDSPDDEPYLRRDKDGTILLFENPWTDALPEDPETKVIYITKVKKLKIEESYGVLNDVLDREFKEIT